MDDKSDGYLLIMQARIKGNRKYSDEKMKNLTEYLTAMTAPMIDQIKISRYSPDKKDPPKAQDPTTVVLDNKKALPLEDVHSPFQLLECTDLHFP